MKEFNLTKSDNDYLQQLYGMFQHYTLLRGMLDREMSVYIIGNIFPTIGLEQDDFQYCNIKIDQGKIEFNEEKKKQDKKEKKE